ncbi:hypothetical protein HKD37_U058884 [Glycine soja]
MAKPSSPTNLASAIICFFASKKFPHRLKQASGKVCKAKPFTTPLKSWSMFIEFSKYALPLVVYFLRNLAEGTLDILLVDCLQKITPKFIF